MLLYTLLILLGCVFVRVHTQSSYFDCHISRHNLNQHNTSRDIFLSKREVSVGSRGGWREKGAETEERRQGEQDLRKLRGVMSSGRLLRKVVCDRFYG